MSRSYSVKYKIDRRVRDNIWGGPKSSFEKRGNLQFRWDEAGAPDASAARSSKIDVAAQAASDVFCPPRCHATGSDW